ncbi:TPA: aquaporin [Serratia liquefaciens]
MRRYVAECVGTCWLVLVGCGSAVMTGRLSAGGMTGVLATAFAFGFAVVAVMAAFGRVSGGHFNPAVTLGAWVAGRFPGERVLGYIVAQTWGGLFGAGLVFVLARGGPGAGLYAWAAGNGYGELSPGGFSLGMVALAECVLTLGYVLVVLGATETCAVTGLAPLAVGLCLAGVHLVGLPIDNVSVNPARSTGVAMLIEGGYMRQLWLFWLAPLGGGLLAGVIYRRLLAGADRLVGRGA